MKRLGSADTGVSIRLLLLLLLAFEFCEGCETGCGRANGLGGPLAPAESRADAEGDGGGSTTPDDCGSELRGRCEVAGFVPDPGEFESAVALPALDEPSGI